jgi:cytidylate kinase
MQAQGVEIPLEIVKKNLQERDAIDYTGNNPTSEKAADARDLDTTNITIDQQITQVVIWAKELLV